MTGIQFIERDGKREFAVIPIELYECLAAALEDADDAALADVARAACPVHCCREGDSR